jgi:hypothetical protein
MQSINLLRIAAEAELLRLRAMLARQGRRAAFGAIALVFTLGVLILVEMAVWQILSWYVAPISATLILLSLNLVIAAACGALAVWSAPDAVERDALRVRQEALDGARKAVTVSAAVPIAGTLLRRWQRRRDRNRPLLRTRK